MIIPTFCSLVHILTTISPLMITYLSSIVQTMIEAGLIKVLLDQF